MRSENDVRAALMTLVPDPATDAWFFDSVHRKITRRRMARRASIVTALAATAAATLVLTMSYPAGNSHPPKIHQPIASAPIELTTLAKIAAAQPAFQPPGPGMYWYFVTRQFGGFCLKPTNPKNGYGYYENCYIHVLDLQQTQTWIAANGSGRVRTTTVSSRFPSRRDRAHWIAAGRPHLDPTPADLRFGPHKLTIGAPGLGKLPTNPAKLAVLIDKRKFEGGPPGPAEDFTQVADLLRLANAPSALRAAAFEVGARIPGVKSLGVISFHGVRGVGIVITYAESALPKVRGAYVRHELIFDPARSTLRAELYVSVRSGKVSDVSWVTYLSAGLVNSITSVLGR